MRRNNGRRGSRADHPAGRAKADFRSSYIRIKSGAHRVDDLSTSAFVRVLKGQPDGTEPGQIRIQVRLAKSAAYIDSPDIDLRPAALFENCLHPARISEPKLPWRVRQSARQVGQKPY